MASDIESTHDSFEDVMRCFSFRVRNQEGENMLGLYQEHNLRVYELILSKEGGTSYHIQNWGE